MADEHTAACPDHGATARNDGTCMVRGCRHGSKTAVHIDPPPPARVPHPCEVGRHRWAWLVDGRQACGYCGRPR